MPIREQALVLAAVAAVAIAGCSTTEPLDTPLTATQPLSLTSVADRREEFAAVFERELAGADTSTQASTWLALPLQSSPARASHPPTRPTPTPRTSVLIAPGIFGDCVASQSLPFGDGVYRPGTANYVEGYRHHQSLGLASIRAVQLKGRASSERNGELLATALVEEQQRQDVEAIVLLGYSKGLPDALLALDQLRREQRLPDKLVALVSIAGVVNGTFLADRYGWLYESLAAQFNLLECSSSEGGEVQSLTKQVRLAWLQQLIVPSSVRLYSIVARTSAEQVAPGLAPSFRALSQLGDRNDGQLLSADAILPGSSLLAEVLSDHWKFVLPLEQHPSAPVRGLVNDRPFPRDALFRAVIRFVLADVGTNSSTR